MKTGAWLVLVLLAPAARAANGLIDELEGDLREGNLAECARRADVSDAPPRASYVGGLCALALHDVDAAEPLFQRAADGGFRPAAAFRKPPERLLSDIAEYRRLAPAPVELKGVPPESLLVGYDRRSPWVDSVVAAAPEFVRIGRRVFGAEPPLTRLFLFSDNAAFERFYGAAFGPHRPHGTGNAGLAVMSEVKARDRPGRAPVGVVLHELMHAWIQGYGRDAHDRRVKLPPWADEGMADYVGSMWDTGLDERRRGELAREIARRPEPPDFARLQEHATFHRREDDFLDYGLSLLLVERLAGPPERGAAKLRAVIDGYAAGSDSETAWKDATGKSPADEYAGLCAELWTKPAP
jgi:hypothetical protein